MPHKLVAGQGRQVLQPAALSTGNRALRWAFGTLWVLLLLGFFSACAPGSSPAQRLASAPNSTGRLVIEPQPAGAEVFVDGNFRGLSPLELELKPGAYHVALSAPGFEMVDSIVDLAAGDQQSWKPTLQDIEAPRVTISADPTAVSWQSYTRIQALASDNAGVVELQLLLGGRLLMSSRGEDLEVYLSPAEIPGLSPGYHTLRARAADGVGNHSEASVTLVVGQASETETAIIPSTTISPSESDSTPIPSPAVENPGPPAAPPIRTPLPTATRPPTATPTRPVGTEVAAAEQPTATSPAAMSTPSGGAGSHPGGTISPTLVPAGSATPVFTTSPATRIGLENVIISTYPYASFVSTVENLNLGNYPVQVLDRGRYEASNPEPIPVSYQAVVMENTYLRMILVPELGGRILECVFKPTGNNAFYRNSVIKPTHWGPEAPAGANWWLGAGGLEWGFPVEEHGYEWATRWGFETRVLGDGSGQVTLYSRDRSPPYVSVTITLPPDNAAFRVQPRIVNGTQGSFRFKWWSNAMLSPGPSNAPGPDLHFLLPADVVTVHSTGDSSLPASNAAMSWPVYNGRDLSRLGNWKEWLGVFARPAAHGDFMGVYDRTADEGMIRVFPSEVARGAKIFAMGWSAPINSREWTDDGSGYVEIHGGLAPTFDDWYVLASGAEISWQESWYPVAGIGHVVHATADGALNLERAGSTLRLGFFPTRPFRGRIEIDGVGIISAGYVVEASPSMPFLQDIPCDVAVGSLGPLNVTVRDQSGRVTFRWDGTP